MINAYRLQLNGQFPFAKVIEIVPYLHELGIDVLYLSPIWAARKGSLHGYDCIDPTRINPELGGIEGFRALVLKAREYRMSIVVDFVPNHMAYSPESKWLGDVLARGKESPFAHFFDIRWEQGTYRRFFDIGDYIGVAMEHDDVFDAYHVLLFQLVDEKLVDGVRVDHIDGLRFPLRYLARLKQRVPFIVVEKILGRGEAFFGWATTGYEYLNHLNGLFIDQSHEAKMTAIYETYTGKKVDPDALLYEEKKFVIRQSFMQDVEATGADIERLARMEIYRTYSEEKDLLFQQLSPAIMAKGLEDTHLYVYNRLISLNEVGWRPTYFGVTEGEYHTLVQQMGHSFFPGSTHDSKRSEDVRLCIDVISEIPDEWDSFVNSLPRWETDPNMAYFLYQTLLAVQDKKRLAAYALKAAKEAKVHTSWVHRNSAYEEELVAFVQKLPDTHPFIERVQYLGKKNSFSACVLRCASPGIVDIYQGTECFNDSLVDPDNRRPVDFHKRDAKHPFITRMLHVRKKFVGEAYLPLKTSSRHVIAILRGERYVAVAGRFFATFAPTEVVLPSDLQGKKWKDVATGIIHCFEKTISVTEELGSTIFELL